MSRKGIKKMGSFVGYTHRNWTIGDPWDPVAAYGRKAPRRTMPPVRPRPDPISVRIVRLEGLRRGSLKSPEDIQHMHEIRLLRKLKKADRPGKELTVLAIWRARPWKTMQDFYLEPGNAQKPCWPVDVEGKRWLLDSNLWGAFDAVENFLKTL